MGMEGRKIEVFCGPQFFHPFIYPPKEGSVSEILPTTHRPEKVIQQKQSLGRSTNKTKTKKKIKTKLFIRRAKLLAIKNKNKIWKF
jgi:hypothetical protein